MKNKTLRLRREALTEIGTEDLTAVVGGSHLCGITDPCTHKGPSIDACPTLPLDYCVAVAQPTLVCTT